jgi:hypothetical protein
VLEIKLSLDIWGVQIMTTKISNTVDTSWAVFIEILSDEFIEKTGFGVYAHITPVDINQAYQDYKQHNEPLRLFVRHYVSRSI